MVFFEIDIKVWEMQYFAGNLTLTSALIVLYLAEFETYYGQFLGQSNGCWIRKQIMESCTKFYCIHNSVFNNKFAPLYPPRFRLHFEEMVPKKLSNSLKICFTKKCAKQKFAYIKSSIKVICMFFLRCSLSMLELWKDTQYEIHSCIELNYPS